MDTDTVVNAPVMVNVQTSSQEAPLQILRFVRMECVGSHVTTETNVLQGMEDDNLLSPAHVREIFA